MATGNGEGTKAVLSPLYVIPRSWLRLSNSKLYRCTHCWRIPRPTGSSLHGTAPHDPLWSERRAYCDHTFPRVSPSIGWFFWKKKCIIQFWVPL